MARAAPATQQQQHGDDEHEELLQGQLQLWHHAFSFLKSMALKCAIDLGIADAVHRCGGTAALPELLAAMELPPSNLPYLRRLMRVLAHSRLFARVDGGQPGAGGEPVYALTAASRLLVTAGNRALFNQAPCIYPFVDRACVSTFFGMGAWMADERAATTSLFERAHGGGGTWDVVKEGFDEAMAADSRLVMRAALAESPEVFQGITSLVDVGGGHGAAAAAIGEAFPHVKCTVLDLPHVVDKAPDNCTVDGDGSLRFVAGDMFEHIPPADAVLLKWILHDWNDEDCIRILRQCKKAIPPRTAGGKVIIIDAVVGSWPCDANAICKETQLLFDIDLMSINGAEREEHEWKRIFLEAGFADYKVTPVLGFRSIIEVYYPWVGARTIG